MPSESGMNRREMLKGLFGAAAVTAVGLESGDAFGKERRERQTLEELQTPRIDAEYSLEKAQEFVGFPVESVSVPLRNVVSTETVRLVYGKDGQFAWMWSIQPGGKVPFKHRHQSEERLSLKRGTLKCWLEGGKVVTATAGKEDFVIPPETDHQPFVDADAKEPVEAVVHFEFEESAARVTTLYWNMVNDGLMNKKGQPNFLKMLVGTTGEEETTYLTEIPQGLQDVARDVVMFFQKGRKLKEDEFVVDVFEA